MLNEEKETFLAQAKLYVPIVEKGLYEDLLCKHYAVFSKDKTDLCKENNFEHKFEENR
jgi:hypothetical protein